MKIVVVGGTGLIGTQVVMKLNERGHTAIAAAPSTGVNAVTGEGLATVLTGADVVIDVSNAPSFNDNAVKEFFETSTRNLLDAENYAGVKHHIALSVVGTDRLQDSAYFQAKSVQERMIRQSPVPWTILESTQFFEFMGGIAKFATEGTKVRVPSAVFQPISSEDVAETLARFALEAPKMAIVEVAGPEKLKMSETIKYYLNEIGDSREVIVDNRAKYFGTEIDDQSLVPDSKAIFAKMRYREWLPSNRLH